MDLDRRVDNNFTDFVLVHRISVFFASLRRCVLALKIPNRDGFSIQRVTLVVHRFAGKAAGGTGMHPSGQKPLGENKKWAPVEQAGAITPAVDRRGG
jgi:hypothetical protein